MLYPNLRQNKAEICQTADVDEAADSERNTFEKKKQIRLNVDYEKSSAKKRV